MQIVNLWIAQQLLHDVAFKLDILTEVSSHVKRDILPYLILWYTPHAWKHDRAGLEPVTLCSQVHDLYL